MPSFKFNTDLLAGLEDRKTGEPGFSVEEYVERILPLADVIGMNGHIIDGEIHAQRWHSHPF